MREESNDEVLLAQARRGNTGAFATLCERHRRRLWHTVASVTRKAADADDLAQEAILRAYRSLGSYRGDAPFGAWLCRIALNAAHDHQKSAWKRKVFFWADDRPDEPDLETPGPARAAERSEVQRRVRTAVSALSDKERTPIWLIYFEDFSLADVARLEGVPESTVRSRVKAGLRRLQSTLEDLGPIGEEEAESSANEDEGALNTVWKECRQP